MEDGDVASICEGGLMLHRTQGQNEGIYFNNIFFP